MNSLYINTLCILTFICSSVVAQDHPAAPKREGAGSVLTEKQARYKFKADQRETLKKNSVTAVSKSFQAEYKKAGSPKIAIFWNTKFSDQLREWQEDERVISNRSGSIEGIDDRKAIAPENDIDANEKNINIKFDGAPDSYSRNFKGNYQESASLIKQTRRWKASRAGLSDEKADFEFGAGFTSIFLRNKVKVIDKDTIMRLTDLDSQGRDSDYQITEAAALKGYADYLAEILMTPDSEAPVGMSFLVTIKEISSGNIIAMLTSDGDPRMTEEAFNEHWIVDGAGYQWREDRPPEQKWVIKGNGYQPVDLEYSPSLIGQQLAIEVISELSMVWE